MERLSRGGRRLRRYGGPAKAAWTGDRREFLSRNETLASPEGLRRKAPLSEACRSGLRPCAVLQTTFDLAPGASIEIVMFIGEGTGSADAASALLARYREADLDHVLADVEEHWRELLETIQVRTPDRALDIMLNGWLLYQTLACRIWARSAFYQASGAYGFRDQLQDGMALTFARPEMTRHHLLRAAARQFVEAMFSTGGCRRPDGASNTHFGRPRLAGLRRGDLHRGDGRPGDPGRDRSLPRRPAVEPGRA